MGVTRSNLRESADCGGRHNRADDRPGQGRAPSCCKVACPGLEMVRRYTDGGLWEGLTVAEMVERTARRQPQKVAVVHGETRATYDDLVRSAKRLTRGLSELELQAQDRVVVQLPNGLEFVSLYLALNYIGVIPVMALRAHRHAEVRHFIRSSEASAYFIADCVGSFDYRPMAAEMAAEFDRFLRHVVVATGLLGPGQLPYQALFANGANGDRAVRRAPSGARRTSRRCCCPAGRRRCRS